MPVTLSSSLHTRLLIEAAKAHPHECCGLLFGTDRTVTQMEATANVADDPARAFEIDPARLIAAERAMRSGGPRPIGHYHSHPNGAATPSAHDAAASAGDGRLWLIVAGGRVSGWRAVPGGAHLGAFDPVDLCVIAR